MIPGINIIIDLVMRLLNDANWYGNYFPSSEVRYPNDLDELISEKARMDGIISERILPNLLELLESNGYPEASVKYKRENENLKFEIHFRENADLSINIPYPIEPVRSTMPLYRPWRDHGKRCFC